MIVVNVFLFYAGSCHGKRTDIKFLVKGKENLDRLESSGGRFFFCVFGLVDLFL